MVRRDLLDQLAELAVDLSPPSLPRSVTDQVVAVCETARLAFAAPAVSVAVLEPGGLRYIAAAGTGAEAIVGELLPIDRGLAGYVAITGQSLAVDRPADDPRFARDVAERTGLIPSSMLIVPIHDAAGDAVGVLSVLDRSIGSGDALALAGAFAAQLGSVLPDGRRASSAARLLVTAVADAVRARDEELADALEREVDQLPEEDAEIVQAAALLQRLRSADPQSRARAVALIRDVVELATAKRRR